MLSFESAIVSKPFYSYHSSAQFVFQRVSNRFDFFYNTIERHRPTVCSSFAFLFYRSKAKQKALKISCETLSDTNVILCLLKWIFPLLPASVEVIYLLTFFLHKYKDMILLASNFFRFLLLFYFRVLNKCFRPIELELFFLVPKVRVYNET